MATHGDIERLASGRAFADLSSWRKVAVIGGDALTWLDALVSADIERLATGEARDALLLTPTGRIRAAFTVSMTGGELLLIQDPGQPRSALDLLSPYVLSSEVTLEDRTEDLGLLAFPGLSEAQRVPGATPSVPSCIGGGVDLLFPASEREVLLRSLSPMAPVSEDGLEAWRIASGRPRMGVDVQEDDLPQEAGLTEAVSFDKGCFPGQEAVAKVRNLGHPRRQLLHLETPDGVSPGDAVFADGIEAGQVTSVAAAGSINVLLARVKWEARQGPFRTATGSELRPRRAGDV